DRDNRDSGSAGNRDSGSAGNRDSGSAGNRDTGTGDRDSGLLPADASDSGSLPNRCDDTNRLCYYVGKDGSDSNGWEKPRDSSTPKLTINAGVSCLNGGDTLIVKNGTYEEVIEAKNIPSGTSGAPTVVESEAKHGAVVMPTNEQIADSRSIARFGRE